MQKEHLSGVEKIERRCFSVPWSLAMLEGELYNPFAVYFTAVEGGAVAGYAGMHAVLDVGYITNIAVAPEDRRRGVARALLERLIEYGRKHGLAELTLEVRQSNAAALSLYEKMGFIRVGMRRNYYTLPRENAVLMSLYMAEAEEV